MSSDGSVTHRYPAVLYTRPSIQADTVSQLGKFTRPRPAGALPRERLFRSLDRARRHPAVWIIGAPGAGKTTLASTYVDSRRLACLWYRMQEEDGDTASFFHYFGVAIQATFAAQRKVPLPHFTPEFAENVGVFARRFFEQAYERLKRPSLIVLDNFERLPAACVVQDVVRELADSLPDGVTLLALSRADPPATLASLRANGVVALVGGEELGLTKREVEQIVARRGVSLEDLELRELQERSQGWAAGVVLALEQKAREAGGAPRAELPDRTATPRVVFDYFAGEVFDRAPPDVQATLARTSLLPAVPAHRIAQLAGVVEAQQILEHFARNNYFTVRLDRGSRSNVYQFHPLFREFLLRRLEEMAPAEELARLRRKAAALLEADGEVDEAVAHFAAAHAWDDVARVAVAGAKDMLAQGRAKRVEGWLDSLPLPLRERSPWILYWMGMCRLASDPAAARAHFESAYRLFAEAGERTGLFSTWAGVIESFVYEWGEFRDVDRWIALLDELLAANPAFPSPQIESRVTAAMFSALMYRQPHRPDLPQWAERVHRLVLATPHLETRMLLGTQLVLFYAIGIGDSAKTRVLFEAMRPPRELDARASPIAFVVWRCAEAVYHMSLGSPQTCIEAVESALEAAERQGVAVMSFFVVSQGVLANLKLGRFAEAAQLLERGRTVLGATRVHDRAHYHLLCFLYAFYTDDTSSAIEHARQAVELADAAGVPFSQAFYRLANAHALFERGRRREALAQLAAARRMGRAARSKVVEVGTAFSLAYFALEAGKQALAVPVLRRVLALCKASEFENRWLWTERTLKRVLAAALEHGIETDYARSLIRRKRLEPGPEMWHKESWPFPVMVYTLGRFAVLIDGKPLEFAGKGQRKPLELLMTLVAFGGRDVSERRVTEVLWPDAEGDAAHEACAVALHRLRKLLQCEQAVTLQRSHLSLDPRYAWVDVWAFERHVAAPTVLGARVHEPDNASALYRGQFLGGYLDLAWTIPMRERLRSKFIRHLAERGRNLFAAGQFNAAIATFERGLEVDGLAEEFYHGLMRCHSALGRRADAIGVYRRCVKILSASLGTAPSARTTSLYEELQRAGPGFE